MVEAYDPSDWEGLGPTMIANAIGASDEGITGLKSGRNEPGTRVAGLWLHRLSVGGRAMDAGRRRRAAPGVPGDRGWPRCRSRAPRNSCARSPSWCRRRPRAAGRTTRSSPRSSISALANIRLRTDRSGERLVLAAGPEGGEYSRFVASLIARVPGASPVTIAATAGSVENALLIERNEARAGLVQSDVAASAITGERNVFRRPVRSATCAPWRACFRSPCTSWCAQIPASSALRTSSAARWRSVASRRARARPRCDCSRPLASPSTRSSASRNRARRSRSTGSRRARSTP